MQPVFNFLVAAPQAGNILIGAGTLASFVLGVAVLAATAGWMVSGRRARKARSA